MWWLKKIALNHKKNIIVPTILARNLDEFKEQLARVDKTTPFIQIDIMDGNFVPATSFSEIDQVVEINKNFPIELHIMAEHPQLEIKKWENNKNVFRAIIHLECSDDIIETIKLIKKNGWSAGLALNPDTPIAEAMPYFSLIKSVLFMTVNPGKQGAEFLSNLEEKIKKFSALKCRPLCAVDGGVKFNNLKLLKSWGVEIFSVGSAIMNVASPKEAYTTMMNNLK